MCSLGFFHPGDDWDYAEYCEKIRQGKKASDPTKDQQSKNPTKIEKAETKGQEQVLFDSSPPPFGSPGWCP